MMNLMIINTYLYVSIAETFINEASHLFNLDFEADARHQTTYEPVHVSRMGTGAGQAGAYPYVAACVALFFPGDRRHAI
jgi:hypothetical protein